MKIRASHSVTAKAGFGATGRQRHLGEDLLAMHLKAIGLKFLREYRFCKARRWRFDFWIPEAELAIEVDGGISAIVTRNGRGVAVGRHSNGGDYEKLNTAAIMGIPVLRFTYKMVKSGEALATIEHAIKNGKPLIPHLNAENGRPGREKS